MKKILWLCVLSVFMVTSAFAAPVWRGNEINNPFTNATLTNSTLIPDIGLATFSPYVDSRFLAMLTVPPTASPGTTFKNFKLNLVSESAYAVSTQGQAGNATYVNMQAEFQYNYKVMRNGQAITSWLPVDLRAYWNCTGAHDDVLSGGALTVPMRLQLTDLNPGDSIYLYVAQNCTSTADNSTMVFIPSSLSWEYQDTK